VASRNTRGAALARLFRIVTLMHGGGRLTQADFAEACECSDRQIRRDLLALREAGVLFDYDRARGYALDPGWSPFELSLTVTEVLALLLARQAVAGQAEMPFAHSARVAFEKIAALLPASLRDRLNEEDAVAYYGGGRRSYGEAPWGQILSAMHQRETVEMDYYTITRDATSTRRADPYHIVWLGGYCQLIAYCHTKRSVLNFAMDGIRAIRPSGARFVVPKEFSLADYLRGATGPVLGEPIEIAVQFDAELARYARRRWARSAFTLTDQPDGTVVLRGMVRGLDDIRRELMTWGRHARVLEPHALRDAILAEAHALTAMYGDG
jgi:predicted DNA-binding transcriptional regulator YafY